MRIRNSYSSSGRSFACQPFNIRSLFDMIWEMSFRLANVIIEQQSFEVLIPHYDRVDSFFYGDPPYYDSEYVYEAEFDWNHHVLLKETLAQCKGKWLISQVDCPEIRYLFKDYDKLFGRKKKKDPVQELAKVETKSFFDCICPATIKFFAHYYIVGDSYRYVWVIREYPPSTEEQAILSHLADHSGVTLRMYNWLVDAFEQRQIANNATRKNRLKLGDTDINESIQAEQNLLDVQQLLVTLSREKQPLIHCAVFLELKAMNMSALESLQSDISMELTRSKITVDRLTLRQKEGFLSVMPFGFNRFGSQFERVLPASAVGNMFPFNFSGKTDPKGFYIGRDKYGTNILVDLDRRGDDKTNSNILILGNSGQGKSYLMKLLLTNLRESGKRVLVLDAEGEYAELAENNGGCCQDFVDGHYMVNILEPKVWSSEPVADEDAPEAFRRSGRISQHIAFLKDWFRSYKDFTDAEVDTIEIMITKLYQNFGLTEQTDYSKLQPSDYPIMSDLYELCLQEYHCYDPKRKPLYTEKTMQNICLGLNSVCVGSESRFFNGHTNIEDNMFLVFGVKGVMELNKKLRCAIEFNILSYMTTSCSVWATVWPLWTSCTCSWTALSPLSISGII